MADRAFSAAQNSQGNQEELKARALEKPRASGTFFKKDSWRFVPQINTPCQGCPRQQRILEKPLCHVLEVQF